VPRWACLIDVSTEYLAGFFALAKVFWAISWLWFAQYQFYSQQLGGI
jgi:hypothetical protein